MFGLEKVAKKMFLGENPTPGREIDIKNTFKVRADDLVPHLTLLHVHASTRIPWN